MTTLPELPEMPDLLPCPFCGGDPVLQEHPAHEHHMRINGEPILPPSTASWTIECCDVGMIKETREEVVVAWNTRAALSSITKQQEPVKCARCEASTAESCNGVGCGYLEAGNGEQPFSEIYLDALEWDTSGNLASATLVVRGEHVKLTAPVPAEQDSEREEDAYVINRLSTILAGVAIAIKGPELPLHRHSLHDLVEAAEVMALERDLLRCQVEELKAAQPSQQPTTQEATDEMIDAACAAVPDLYRVDAMRAIEAALSVMDAAPPQEASQPAGDADEELRLALDDFYKAAFMFGKQTNRADYDAAQRARRRINDLFEARATLSPSRNAVIEECVQWIDQRREAFMKEHGFRDPSTGTWEYGTGAHAEAKLEYETELVEIADGLRGLKGGDKT